MKMYKEKKNSVVGAMDYQSCLKFCIEAALGDGLEMAVEIYINYPTPSSAAWLECVRDVAGEKSENIHNPHHLMGCYELALLKRGIRTVSGMVIGQMIEKIDAKAIDSGIPTELSVEARNLYLLNHGLFRENKNDH